MGIGKYKNVIAKEFKMKTEKRTKELREYLIGILND
jgi:hypothetical protein